MKKHKAAILIFCVMTLIFMWPVVANITKVCPGFHSSDEIRAPIWSYWHIKNSIMNTESILTTDYLAFPYGVKIFDVFSYVYLGYVTVLSLLFNHIAAYNIQIFANFVLTGVFTYLLAYRLTKNKAAGILAGVIFTFCPQHFMRSWQHITLSYFQWIPLYVLALFKLKDKPKLGNSQFMALAVLLAAFFELHYLYFLFVTTVLFVCFNFIYRFRDTIKHKIKFLKFLIIGGLAGGALIMAQYYRYVLTIILKTAGAASAHNVLLRPFEDLFLQSARPLGYLLPSTEHPVFGGFTSMFIGSSIYGKSLTEHNLYLGLVALVLAIFGIRFYKRNKIKDRSVSSDGFAIIFFLCLGVTAWLFSQPPWWTIFGFKLYMPSFIVYKALPMFRAYCRFGILLSFAVSILAAFGIKYILMKHESSTRKKAICLLLFALICFDFWNNPATHVLELRNYPEVYDWVKAQGDVVIAEYPLDCESPNDFYKFNQTIHEKKIINGTPPGTVANKVAFSITDLSKKKTAAVLRYLGARYVIVHEQDYEESELVDKINELKGIKTNSGLKLVKEYMGDKIRVYEVVASPIEPEIKE